MQRENVVFSWVAAYLDRQTETLRKEEFEQWLSADPANREDFGRMLDLYRRSKSAAMAERIEEAKAWARIHDRIRIRRRSLRRRVYGLTAGAAAAVAVAAACFTGLRPDAPSGPVMQQIAARPGSYKAVLHLSDGTTAELDNRPGRTLHDASGAAISVDADNNIVYDNGAQAGNSTNTVVVPRGGIYSVVLSDGTRVWLNADSRLTYPVKFGNEGRQVTLQGEAYFEVVSNPSNPFTVHCPDGCSVRATGTRFNVRTHDPSAVAASLAEGRIALTDAQGRTARLTPGMEGVFSAGGVVVSAVDTELVTSWVRGMFEFDNQPLGEIIARLSRWYDIPIEIADPALAGLRFTASASTSENLSFLIELIERISPARFANAGGKVVVTSVK